MGTAFFKNPSAIIFAVSNALGVDFASNRLYNTAHLIFTDGNRFRYADE
jgi:hypothetical protein